MNNQRRCGRVYKITENRLNTAAFGHMEHSNISNVAPTNLQTYLKDRLSQVSVQWGYCLF